MDDRKQHEIAFVCDASLPDESFRPFVEKTASSGLIIAVSRRASGQIYAGSEWYLPASLVLLYLATPYLDGLLRETGRRHYLAIKEGLSSLWPAFFGDERKHRVTVHADPPGKVEAVPLYSRALSVIARPNGGLVFKLLLRDTSSKDELVAAFSCFQEFLNSVHFGVLGSTFSSKLEGIRPVGGMVLLSYDPAKGHLCVLRQDGGTRAQEVTEYGAFPHERILALRELAVRARLHESRMSLFAGIQPTFQAGLPISQVPGEQVLLDLDNLNLVGILRDGSFPLETWLGNAVALLGPRPEGAGFQQALDELKQSSTWKEKVALATERARKTRQARNRRKMDRRRAKRP